MNATEISVYRLPGQTGDRRIGGIVTIQTAGQTAGNRTYILSCSVAYCGPDGARAALIGDALRQLSRMPEHRRKRAVG